MLYYHNMAKISGGGSITRLTLLGLLAFRPMHGYELRSEIELRRMERWANVQSGSIYAGLRRLADEGHVESAGTSREGRRPERTTYRITARGQDELRRLLRDTWSEPALMADPVDVAISFAVHLPTSELVELLIERIRRLGAIAEEVELARRQHTASRAAPLPYVIDLFDHSRRRIRMEREWAEHVLTRVQAGAYEVLDGTQDPEPTHAGN